MYIYLAILEHHVKVDNQLKEYFKEKEIKILKNYSYLGMLKIESSKELDSNNLRYIKNLEPDLPMGPATES